MANRKDEIHTESVKIDQPDTVTFPGIDEEFDPSPSVIAAREKEFKKDQYDRLRFYEEPITVRFEPQAGEFAPRVVDCWVNGKGPEVLQGHQWVEYGAFPIGVELTTKRKYIDQLARSRTTTIKTRIVGPQEERPKNELDRYTSMHAPFTIIEDKNPLGREWAKRVMSHA